MTICYERPSTTRRRYVRLRREADKLEFWLSRIALPVELEEDDASWFYIVLASELETPISPQLSGVSWTRFAELDVFREAIGERWRGSGPAIMVNDECISESSGWHTKDWIDNFLRPVVVHEVAHNLDGRRLFIGRKPQPSAALETLSDLAVDPKLWNEYQGAPRWFCHGPNWIRAVLHLGFRGRLLGWPMRLDCVASWANYGVRDLDAMAMCLITEMVENRNKPIRHILNARAPEEFYNKWAEQQLIADSLDEKRQNGAA